MACRDNWEDSQLDREFKLRHDIATRLACAFCAKLEREGQPIPEFAKDWWDSHKRSDEARFQREQADREREADRQSAINKLTERERKALGL